MIEIIAAILGMIEDEEEHEDQLEEEEDMYVPNDQE